MENPITRPFKGVGNYDLFLNFDPNTLKKNTGEIKNKDYFYIVSIFKEFVDLFFLDVIENNVIFALPCAWGLSWEISMQCMDKDFIINHSSLFENLDWIATDFSAYLPCLSRCHKGNTRIYTISNKHHEFVIEQNNNLRYESASVVKTYKDYIPDLKKIFPNESIKKLTAIIKYAIHSFMKYVNFGLSVRLIGNKTILRIGLLHSKKRTFLLKERYLARHVQPHDWYFFALTKERYKQAKYRKGRLVNFGTVLLQKNIKACTASNFPYIFAVPIELTDKYTIMTELVTKKAILIAKRNDGTYKYTNNEWTYKNSRWRNEQSCVARTTDIHQNWWTDDDVKLR